MKRGLGPCSTFKVFNLTYLHVLHAGMVYWHLISVHWLIEWLLFATGLSEICEHGCHIVDLCFNIIYWILYHHYLWTVRRIFFNCLASHSAVYFVCVCGVPVVSWKRKRVEKKLQWWDYWCKAIVKKVSLLETDFKAWQRGVAEKIP